MTTSHQAAAVRVAADAAGHRYGFRQLIESRCLDIVQPDITWLGGMTEARRVVAVAEYAAGAQCCIIRSPLLLLTTYWSFRMVRQSTRTTCRFSTATECSAADW